jgi:hypothetical protein
MRFSDRKKRTFPLLKIRPFSDPDWYDYPPRIDKKVVVFPRCKNRISTENGRKNRLFFRLFIDFLMHKKHHKKRTFFQETGKFALLDRFDLFNRFMKSLLSVFYVFRRISDHFFSNYKCFPAENA